MDFAGSLAGGGPAHRALCRGEALGRIAGKGRGEAEGGGPWLRFKVEGTLPKFMVVSTSKGRGASAIYFGTTSLHRMVSIRIGHRLGATHCSRICVSRAQYVIVLQGSDVVVKFAWRFGAL